MSQLIKQAMDYYRHGNFGAAVDCLDHVLTHRPRDAEALELRGVIHRATGRFEVAIIALETAQDVRPLSCTARLALADCYCVCGRAESARSIYQDLSELPNLPCHLLSDVAAGAARVGDYGVALGVCQTALKREPGSDQALYGVVFYMSKAGLPAVEILPLARQLMEQAPGVFLYRVAVVTLLESLDDLVAGYLVIADATPAELRSLECACCVQRLMKLYGEFGDATRAEMCRLQLAALPSS
tara:strand:- start:17 stop:742 length:726 start_codon:yes stop_codon:yes gene_type:complete